MRLFRNRSQSLGQLRSFLLDRRIIALAIIVTTVISGFILCVDYIVPNANTRMNYLLSDPSSWTANHAHRIYPNHPEWGTVEDIQDLRAATWPGSYPIPQLRAPLIDKEEETPALLMLHIFSMVGTDSRRRRELIRANSPLLSIPEAYRHLVEVNFVIGHPKSTNEMVAGDKRAMAIEMGLTRKEGEKYGDLITLDDLKYGENMNDGKTLSWSRWVGRPGGREAQWVM